MSNIVPIITKLGHFVSISTLAPNNYIVYFIGGEIFYSYNDIIVIKCYGDRTYLTQKWESSNTTGKYRNKYFGFDKKELIKRINKEEIILL